MGRAEPGGPGAAASTPGGVGGLPAAQRGGVGVGSAAERVAPVGGAVRGQGRLLVGGGRRCRGRVGVWVRVCAPLRGWRGKCSGGAAAAAREDGGRWCRGPGHWQRGEGLERGWGGWGWGERHLGLHLGRTWRARAGRVVLVTPRGRRPPGQRWGRGRGAASAGPGARGGSGGIRGQGRGCICERWWCGGTGARTRRGGGHNAVFVGVSSGSGGSARPSSCAAHALLGAADAASFQLLP